MSLGIRITTGARLHFGLLDIAAPFGGCGVMIDQPATIVEAAPARQFAYSDLASSAGRASRAIAIAARIAGRLALNSNLPPVSVRVIQAAPPHTGLGSGTQLSLAIAEAILCVLPSPVRPEQVWQTPAWRELWLHAADRGLRSAVGTHGYQQGGFIAEGLRPEHSGDALNPLDVQLDLPSAWRATILLPAMPLGAQSAVSGEQEQAKFAALPPVSPARRQSLKQMLTGALIPAIENADFATFCDAVTQYNRSSGLLFADVQGGAYNGAATTQLVSRLLEMRYLGVGQSSWGPGVFVWHPDGRSAEAFRKRFSDSDFHVLIAAPKNDGRLLETISEAHTPTGRS